MEDTKLSEEEREARNKYMREYRRKNKDKIARINKRYWKRKAEEMEDKEESKQ